MWCVKVIIMCVTQRDVGVVCQGNYYVCYPERRGCGVSR